MDTITYDVDMTEWQDILPSAELAPGEVVEAEWQGEDLLLYRTFAGECRAITAYCPHMGNYIPNGLAPRVPISELLHEDELRCPFHEWRFDGEGRCTHIPEGQPVPSMVRQGKPVARYWLVREAGGKIQLAEP